MARTRWYKDRVFYQIWPRSFKDGNGDGIGDLWGVFEKLDYIKSLGMGGIWFSPLFPSPGADCGCDVSNFTDIAPEYGGIEAFQQVLEGAHQRDMKVIMDLVINHTSNRHEWFQNSRQRIEPYTDYYIWRPSREDGSLPNNWDSRVEGKAWTWDDVRQEYYLHLFSDHQPDLNMDNPLVRNELKRIMRFWLDLGVDGFNLDGLSYISKKEDLPDDYLYPVCKGLSHYNHGPNIHQYLREFNRDVFHYYDCITLAEPPFITPKQALKYIEEGEKQEIDMMLPYQPADDHHAGGAPLSLPRMKQEFSNWQQKLDGRAWNMLYLENQNHPRSLSFCENEAYWREGGKMLAVCYLFQKGTPFVYQGQEIGMTNCYPEDAAAYEEHSPDAESLLFSDSQPCDDAALMDDVLPEQHAQENENTEDTLTEDDAGDDADVPDEESPTEEKDFSTDDNVPVDEAVQENEESQEDDDILSDEDFSDGDGVLADAKPQPDEDILPSEENSENKDVPLDENAPEDEDFSADEDFLAAEGISEVEDILSDEDALLNEAPYLDDDQFFKDIQALLQDDPDFNLSSDKQDASLWHSTWDPARSPMQWSEETNAGFSTERPWSYVNQNYKQVNVAEQEDDPYSILNFYRQAIGLRQKLSCVRYGDYQEYRRHSSKVYMYSRRDGRQRILVVCSFCDKKLPFRAPRDFHTDTATLVLQNYSHIKANVLQPYEARVYLWK